jgi:hypothetical protein
MLEALTILAYEDDKFSESRKIGKCELQINPETLSHNHQISWKEYKNITTDTTIKLETLNPQTLSFAFYIDASGMPLGDDDPPKKYKIKSVADKIKEFKELAFSLNGTIHSPNFLKVLWGGFEFRCRLNKLDIEYTLFKPSGIPLRAKVSVAFTEYLSEDAILKLQNKQSPDLTHARTVIAGDSLPLMCHRIYGDSRYYLAVAEVNGLRDFRNLKPGMRIIFPPLTR